jgi:hypothetical protein
MPSDEAISEDERRRLILEAQASEDSFLVLSWRAGSFWLPRLCVNEWAFQRLAELRPTEAQPH